MSSASVMYPTGFLLMINGQIETAQFFNASDIYCKYCFVHGPDWNVLSGIEEGLSQMCCRSSLENSADGFVLNFPVELTLKSTNSTTSMSTYSILALLNHSFRLYCPDLISLLKITIIELGEY
ncbi:B9 domain-containing protein 1 [Trichinella spiralis]|uniref:B9 domain-containing protein 1 n=1 Tax=Trichinella spiralis TaxID=6334 RepID=UPI0001EFD48F|nr:B9 domain-containing protein 1 [Trichinella spiralis]